ncbi:MAG: hypothetical protein IKH15_04845 [Bacteroidales bacterium]|nr:hypothetical protein [Bacteroidales bacterium]
MASLPPQRYELFPTISTSKLADNIGKFHDGISRHIGRMFGIQGDSERFRYAVGKVTNLVREAILELLPGSRRAYYDNGDTIVRIGERKASIRLPGLH